MGLTLERIAELRAMGIAATHARDITSWRMNVADVGMELLDAAERGLLADRKAAAFDRLVANGGFTVQVDGDMTYLYHADGESSDAPTLLEAIEALPTSGEP